MSNNSTQLNANRSDRRNTLWLSCNICKSSLHRSTHQSHKTCLVFLPAVGGGTSGESVSSQYLTLHTDARVVVLNNEKRNWENKTCLHLLLFHFLLPVSYWHKLHSDQAAKLNLVMPCTVLSVLIPTSSVDTHSASTVRACLGTAF